MTDHLLVGVCTAVSLFVGAWRSLADENVAIARSAVENVVSELRDSGLDSQSYLMEFGFKYRQSVAYPVLASSVSNNVALVWDNFSTIATNELSRLILLSSGWAYDDGHYLSCYSNVLDLVERGVVSARELEWYVQGSRNERRANLLALRFADPGVSNLIERTLSCTGETNYWGRALSGEIKQALEAQWAAQGCDDSPVP